MARRWVTSRGTDGVQRLNQTRASIVSRSAGKPLAHRAANVQRTTYASKANPAGFLAETFGGPSESYTSSRDFQLAWTNDTVDPVDLPTPDGMEFPQQRSTSAGAGFVDAARSTVRFAPT